MNYEIRPVRVSEEALILTFVYLAAWMPQSNEPIQKAFADPFLRKYWVGWGRPGDLGFVAVDRSNEMPVSCAWVRQFSKAEASATFVSDDVPELGFGTVDGFRGQGIGSAVLRALIGSAMTRCRGICLIVREENPAVRLYERLGIQKITGSDMLNRVGTRSFRMLLDFGRRDPTSE